VFKKTIFTSQISTFIDWFRHLLTGKPVNRLTLHISLHHMTRFEPITAAHFDQRYNNMGYWPVHRFTGQ